MRIGKQDQPFSAICTSDAHSITVRGRDLCGDIIGQFDFSSYFWFLVTGQQPNEQQWGQNPQQPGGQQQPGQQPGQQQCPQQRQWRSRRRPTRRCVMPAL